MIEILRCTLILLLLVQCKNKVQKPVEEKEKIITFSKKQPIENLKDEKVIVSLNFNDQDDAYLIIRNQLKEDIIINRYLLGSSLVALDQYINGESIQINQLPLPVPPLNLNKYDTIIRKNNQIFIAMYDLDILNKLPEDNTKIRACISYKLKHGEHEEACSDWMVYEK